MAPQPVDQVTNQDPRITLPSMLLWGFKGSCHWSQRERLKKRIGQRRLSQNLHLQHKPLYCLARQAQACAKRLLRSMVYIPQPETRSASTGIPTLSINAATAPRYLGFHYSLFFILINPLDFVIVLSLLAILICQKLSG